MVAVGICSSPASAAWQANAEAGAVLLTPPTGASSWGSTLGAALAWRATDLIWVVATAQRSRFAATAAEDTIDTTALLLRYALDVLPLAPFFEFGAARAVIAERRRQDSVEFAPLAGLGFDIAVTSWLQTGATVRYLPVLGSDLLASPAVTSWQGRLSVCLGCF
jgi:hypothetical protein